MLYWHQVQQIIQLQMYPAVNMLQAVIVVQRQPADGDVEIATVVVSLLVMFSIALDVEKVLRMQQTLGHEWSPVRHITATTR